jgi:transcriptional regulator with XRE-family HTH domain
VGEPVGPMVRIRALRDAHGLTAEQLADRMSDLGVTVNPNTLYNIEVGAKKPSDRILNAYARALGVNPLDVWQGPLRPATAGIATGPLPDRAYWRRSRPRSRAGDEWVRAPTAR